MVYIGTGLCILAGLLVIFIGLSGERQYVPLALIPLVLGGGLQAVGFFKAHKQRKVTETQYESFRREHGL